MKNYILVILALIPSYVWSQDINVTVEASNHEVLLGNYVIVKFTLENATGEFHPPDFGALTVMSGPNISSSFSMINGEVKQSLSYTYFLKPEDVGHYSIGSASFEVNNELVESLPFTLAVLLNPDEKIQRHDQFMPFDSNHSVTDGSSDSISIRKHRLKRFRKHY